MTKQEFDDRIAKWGFVPLLSQPPLSYEYGAISAFGGNMHPLLISLLCDDDYTPFCISVVYCQTLGHKFTQIFGGSFEDLIHKFFQYLLSEYPEAKYD